MILSISPVYRRLFDGHMEDSADSHIVKAQLQACKTYCKAQFDMLAFRNLIEDR